LNAGIQHDFPTSPAGTAENCVAFQPSLRDLDFLRIYPGMNPDIRCRGEMPGYFRLFLWNRTPAQKLKCHVRK